MRQSLQKINTRRGTFIATFVRYGSKKAFKGPSLITLLFEKVGDSTGYIFEDHIWFTTNKSWQKLNLEPGDKVSFDARVKKYTKGYRGSRPDIESNLETDYKLSHPTNIRLIKNSQQEIQTSQNIGFGEGRAADSGFNSIGCCNNTQQKLF